MALICEREGLVPELRAFAAEGRPVWGTCAGMIFLASGARGGTSTGSEKLRDEHGGGAQCLLGGLPITVDRNFFGPAAESFEADLRAPAGTLPDASAAGYPADAPCRAVFIRAPAITDPGAAPSSSGQKDAGGEVERLMEMTLSPDDAARLGKSSVCVAVRRGRLLATSFHPELTDDPRWHALFVGMVREASGGAEAPAWGGDGGFSAFRAAHRPADVPLYKEGSRGLALHGK